MHDTSALWKQILSEPDHRKEVKVTINGNEYGENRIVGVSVSGGLFDAPGVGNAVARTLELNIMPLEAPFGLIPPMSEIRCFVRLVSADGQRVSEYIQKGVFYADTVTRDSDTGMVSVTAFDAIMRMNQLFGQTACTVTYDDGFGNTQKFECDIGDAMPTVDDPSRDDLDFIGWNPVPEGVVVRDTLFVAQWRNTVIESGSLGNDVRYTLYKNGLLEVSGSGPTYNYGAFIRYFVEDAGHYKYLWTQNASVPYAFLYLSQNTKQIKRVKINPGVTTLGAYIFAGCSQMTEIEIPDTVTSIQPYAFLGCRKLIEIVIPSAVTNIGANAFRACSSLTKIGFHDRITGINSYSFAECTALQDVTIPPGVTAIGYSAFWSCTLLKSVTIPEGVTYIGTYAFGPYNSLRDVYYGGSEIQREAITIGEYNHKLTGAVWHYGKPTYTVTFLAGDGTDTAESVRTDAQAYTLPENCFTSPSGSSFFEWISSGDSEYASGDTITLESDMTLTAVWQTANLIWTIRDGVLHIGGSGNMENYSPDSPPPWYDARDSVTSVIMRDGATSIGDYAFYNCANLAEVRIPSSVSNIGNNAFAGCAALADVYYDGSWQDCDGITFGTGNDALSTIHCTDWDYTVPLARGECGAAGDNLTWELYRDGSLYINGTGAMADYNSGSDTPNAPWYVWRESITEVHISDEVTSIGDGAFRNCAALTYVEGYRGVISIGPYAFENCINLRYFGSVYRRVTAIEDYAFSGCSGLAYLEFPDTLVSIGDYAFAGCDSIVKVQCRNPETLQNSIEIGIGNEALDGKWSQYWEVY